MSTVAVNGSPSTSSKTHAVATAALDISGGGTLIDVSALDADALLLRGNHPSVTDALATMAAARILVLATPVYRATYSGVLKLLLDLLAPEALRGTVVVLAATGASSAHFLALDTGLRAVVASLGGMTVPTVVYATGDDFDVGGQPSTELRDRLRVAVGEAALVADAIDAIDAGGPGR